MRIEEIAPVVKEKREIVKKESLVRARFWFGVTSNNLDEIVKISKETDIGGEIATT